MFDLARLERVSPCLWEIPKSFRDDMRVPARIYSSEAMLKEIVRDRSLEQLVNVATLPGIALWALAMPDAHEGYGFPVGGIAAFDEQQGVISPGGIGYDINCGVRVLRSDLKKEDVLPHLRNLGRTLFAEVPSGVGRGGRLAFRGPDLDAVLVRGARRMLELGYATEDDLAHTESEGVLPDADPAFVSQQAKSRGHDQLGTMGAGNHFVEVGYVEQIFDADAAEKLGLCADRVTVLIHTGSRGFGHQVATDHIRVMNRAMPRYNIELPDRELACVPFDSEEGRQYFAAMQAAANFAWANRQLITHEVRQAFRQVFSDGALSLVYDVAHNIAKLEEYRIGPVSKRLVVHRKGATRAFPGQPVLIPGSMGTASYVLLGQQPSLEASFGSSCHGAGRRMSRTQARKDFNPAALRAELAKQGIVVNAGSGRGFVEEAPLAYKDVDAVVNVVHDAGIAKKVVRLRPLVVVKG